MIGDGALRALRDAAGEAAVLEHDPISLDGAKLGLTIAPETAPALAATLAACSEHGVGLAIRGGGSRMGLGNRPDPRVVAWLSTAAVAGELRVEADEGVAWASGATAVTELDQAVREAGWRAPLEPAGPTSTVGGALAAALPGPRALGLGRARDVALGLDVALATGELTRCGARVVKNVSGYDLAKLQIGAFGTLGVLVGAWLRLRPRPEAERAFVAVPHDAADPFALDLSRRASARAVASFDPVFGERFGLRAGSGFVWVELAGDAAVVAEDEAWLRSHADVAAAPDDAVDHVRAIASDDSLGTLVFRIALSPSRFGEVRERLRDAGARTVAQPGLAQIQAGIPLQREDEAAADEACRAVRSAAEGAGSLVLERAPVWAKEGRDVFDARAETLPLQRALKREFDPAGVLNPGRFAGGLA